MLKRISFLIFLIASVFLEAQTKTDMVLIDAAKSIKANDNEAALRLLKEADKNDYRVVFFKIIAGNNLAEKGLYGINQMRDLYSLASGYIIKYPKNNSKYTSQVRHIRDNLEEKLIGNLDTINSTESKSSKLENPKEETQVLIVAEDDPNVVTTLSYKSEEFEELQQEYKYFFRSKYSEREARIYKYRLQQLKIDGLEIYENQRDKILEEIEKFKNQSCELKEYLDRLKTAGNENNSSLASVYEKLENEYEFPYLKFIIKKMSKDIRTYTDKTFDPCN